MATKVKFIPNGFHAVTPYLIVKNAAQAIDFYKRAFGAHERYRLTMGSRIGHAELQFGNSIVMLADEFPDCGNVSPQTLNGSPVSLALYVENVDQSFKRAVQAGATVKDPVENKFWGDRAGSVIDPFGHKWTLLTHTEDVSPSEMQSRMEHVFAGATSE
jgi:PhnB protein